LITRIIFGDKCRSLSSSLCSLSSFRSFIKNRNCEVPHYELFLVFSRPHTQDQIFSSLALS
jgi:hypothetical protein